MLAQANPACRRNPQRTAPNRAKVMEKAIAFSPLFQFICNLALKSEQIKNIVC
jgi:hypothetical protein